MEIIFELPKSFSVESLPKKQNIKELLASQKWDELAKVPVCTDSYGKVVAYFGDDIWDCTPFFIIKGLASSERQLSFNYLIGSPGLLLQAKLIAYGWIHHVAHRSGKRCKFSTLAARVNSDLKRVLVCLKNQNVDDICELQKSDVWAQLENDIESAKLHRITIEKVFSSLSAVTRLGNWLPFHLTLPDFQFKKLACKLAVEGKIEIRQTLAIPQAIADILYGEAVNLVEQAWPHQKALIELERKLQANYNAGRAVVDQKITSGHWTWMNDENGKLNTDLYASEVHRAMPNNIAVIVVSTLKNTGLLPLGPINGMWLVSWRTQLQTACFICCGAFSGMRVSELLELHHDSFYTHEIDGQVFNSLRAATHKLAAGKKPEEWLCSPIVKKAIELAHALSKNQRETLLQMAKHSRDPARSDALREQAECLWLNQKMRSRPPIMLGRGQWNQRLKIFAKSIGAVVDEKTLEECRLLNPQSAFSNESVVRVGLPWPFTTHQFRRTFACFAVRNHLGHPIALKQQFKHLYLRMSAWYSNGAVTARLQHIQVDSDISSLLNEAGIEYTTATYDKWFNGKEPLSGSYGKAIVAMRDDRPVIYSTWDNLYRLVKEKRLSLHGTLHSYCKNGYDCDMDGVVNPAFCVDCSGGGSVIDTEKALWWKQRHGMLTAYLNEQVNVSHGEYAHCITQIRAAEQVMLDHQLDHTTYQHPIEVLML
ncbi:hypothetical protein [Aeromonas veronii]|uniref:hypothetical protein n=1 Tax=Aeromonas veronii TaxID=654 RepID=UPI00403DC21A